MKCWFSPHTTEEEYVQAAAGQRGQEPAGGAGGHIQGRMQGMGIQTFTIFPFSTKHMPVSILATEIMNLQDKKIMKFLALEILQ